MTREWSKDETFRLIQMYKESTALWDTKSREHRNKDKRSVLLRTIADEFSTTTEEVNRKLHNLRSQLSQEFRKARKREANGYENSFNVKWPFFESLKFLSDISIPRKSRNAPNYFIVNQDPLQQTMELYDESQEYETGSIGESEASTSNMSESKRKDFGIPLAPKRLCAPPEEVFHSAVKVTDDSEDDFTIFGKYIASEMRGFRSQDSVQRFKIGVQRLLLDVLESEYSQDQRQVSRGTM